jgi:hypothetical protein
MNVLLHSELAHFIIYIAISAIISGMPAPGVSSGTAYKWAFSSLNIFAANFTRARGAKLESSPNFQDALNVQQTLAGQPQTPVVKPPDPVVPKP